MIEKLLNAAGDWVFTLRDRWDKLRRRGGEVRQRPPRQPIDWKQFRKPQYWRQALNHNARGSLLLLAVCLSGALGLLGYRVYQITAPPPPYRPPNVWFMDLSSGELFVVSGLDRPPIPAPSGKTMEDGSPAGVRAHVYSCGECEDPNQRFVAFVETHSADAEASAAPAAEPADPGAPPNFEFIARADLKGGWVGANTREARRIMAEQLKRCGETVLPRDCFPPETQP